MISYRDKNRIKNLINDIFDLLYEYLVHIDDIKSIQHISYLGKVIILIVKLALISTKSLF